MTATESEPTTVVRKHPEAECEKCPLYSRGIAPTQFPTGSCKAAVVSRSPGYHDVNAGRPFGGPSGEVLTYLLAQQGVKRNEVMVTNVVLCNSPEGKVPPEAIKACAPRLAKELADTGNATIIAAGAEAVTSIIGPGGIDSRRGYVLERNGRRVVATNNPALVLRDDSKFPNLVKDFKRAFNPTPTPTLPRVVLIERRDDARKLIEKLSEHSGITACDIESRGGLTHKATLVSFQIAIDGTSAYVLGEREGLWDDRDFIDNYLRSFLESTDRSYVWHNGIFDTKILRHSYSIAARVDEDTLLLSWACDERGGQDTEGSLHSLEYLMMEEFAWPYYTPASVAAFKKSGRLVSEAAEKAITKKYVLNTPAWHEAYEKIENQNYLDLYKYAGHDAAGTFQLFELLKDRATADSVYDKPYKETLLAAEDVLRSMETTGMPYDYHRAAEMLEKEVQPEMVQITKDLGKLTGRDLLNPGSHTQMASVYYDELKVFHAMQERPDKKRSVDESSRKEMVDGRFTFSGEHTANMVDGKMVKRPADNAGQTRNLISKIAREHDRYKKLEKQAGTYLTGLIKEAELDPESRIYTTLARHATSTGRLASRGPNLQNVTRTKEGLPDIRGLFFALPGTLLVQADYSQAELRTIAALSGDRLLSGVYERGEDLHNLTAERFYGKDYTKENRANSKNMNFGVFYRQSAETFLEKHEIAVEEAQKYIDWVWSTFTTVGEWEKSIEKLVHQQKHRDYSYVESPFGHRRRFYLITPQNRQALYREAINFLPQNIAANFTLHACIRLHENADPKRARLCLTVHDSILAQVEEDYVEEYRRICAEVMESMPHDLFGWTLPYKADVGAGKTWATA